VVGRNCELTIGEGKARRKQKTVGWHRSRRRSLVPHCVGDGLLLLQSRDSVTASGDGKSCRLLKLIGAVRKFVTLKEARDFWWFRPRDVIISRYTT
jgi:hypothetical protein